MRNVAGLDVHKDSVFLCIDKGNEEKVEQKFGVLTPELQSMCELMRLHDVSECSMESTAIYWLPVWRVLREHMHLRLANPYMIRQLPGRKSDIKDAQWIAECTRKELISSSYVPDDKIQQLRQYNRRIYDLNKEIVRKLNKIDAALQRCNIRLSNYVSNTKGKSYKSVVNAICEGETRAEELVKLIHGRILNNAGRETLIAALQGIFNESDIDVLRQLKDEVDLATKHKTECEEKMLKFCQENFPKQLENLQTIPGVSEQSATSIIAEVGTDMSFFRTPNHLSSWSGLRPRNDESNHTIKSRKITHGNRYLRQTLIQCAHAASRTKGCFFNKFSYQQVQVRRKAKNKVTVAIARKLLVCVWHILHDEVGYVDCLTGEILAPKNRNINIVSDK